MENQDKDSFDAESWAEEGIAEAKEANPAMFADDGIAPGEGEETQDKQVEETKSQEQQKDETKPETEEQQGEEEEEVSDQEQKETDSSISKILNLEEEKQQTDEDRVPVEQHIKLRKRAQAAEQEVADLRRQLSENKTQTEGDTSGEKDPLAEYEDEDLVRAGDVRQTIEREVQKGISKLTKTIEENQQSQTFQRQAINAVQSEKAFKEATPDYDEVTSKARKLNAISDADRKEILQADNPAKKYYEISKAKIKAAQEQLALLGFVPANTKTTPKSEANQPEGEEKETENMSDEEIFDEVFGD